MVDLPAAQRAVEDELKSGARWAHHPAGDQQVVAGGQIRQRARIRARERRPTGLQRDADQRWGLDLLEEAADAQLERLGALHVGEAAALHRRQPREERLLHAVAEAEREDARVTPIL